MKVIVNGSERAVDPPCTVARLLEASRLHNTPCAVEVNKSLVPKRRHAEHVLSEGDCVEIVTLVGGG